MKKLSIFLIVALAMISCGSTYKSKSIKLADFQDSINYAVGYFNAVSIKAQMMSTDSSDAAIKAFMDEFEKAYKTGGEISRNVEIGRNFANQIRNSEITGLAENPQWALDESVFFKGVINGIISDSSLITFNEAQEFFQKASQETQVDPQNEQKAGCVKKASCPTSKTMQQVKLNNKQDSLNYAFGYLNGFQLNQYVFATDTNPKAFDEFVKALNETMKQDNKYSELKNLGANVGRTIKQQEPQGLLATPEWETRFEIIKQGFINGFYNFNGLFDKQNAETFISESIDKYKFGDVKEKNTIWLEENAKKENVKVTDSGLQYEVIKMGKGKKPTRDDKVKVHYHGTLTNGTVFDSSVDRGEPIEFELSRVIAGWTEGLQLMPVGSKFRFYIKPELAYGDADMGTIPPYSILIFDVDLLDITTDKK